MQCPLQPLFDNLDCGIYEVFEKDPVKYRQYELAIIKALEDKIPVSDIESKKVCIKTNANNPPYNAFSYYIILVPCIT